MSCLAIPTISSRLDADITIPGSKSITNRALLAAALSEGQSTLEHALFSEDTQIFSAGLRHLGIPVEEYPREKRFVVTGREGAIPALDADLFVGNAGTAARFITALTMLGAGRYRFDGVPAMRVRPMGDLLTLLETQGARIDYEGQAGHMPFVLRPQGFAGGPLRMRANRTSQQLSALLMVAPYAARDTTIEIEGELVSQPYLTLTCRLMRAWGVDVVQQGERSFRVACGQRYRPQRFFVEPDASGASYFFAAAAALGGRVRVKHLTQDATQGDVGFVDVLAAMGCQVVKTGSYIEVVGTGSLQGIDADFNAISDTMPTLAAIAPFAAGPVTIRNVEHTRWKETDRIKAVVAELCKLGASVEEFQDGLTIYPSALRGAAVDTYDDHRIAMSFAVTGLRVPGLHINSPECTAKTFPDFFQRLFVMVGAAEAPDSAFSSER